MIRKWLLLVLMVLLGAGLSSAPSGGADQPDFPLIYIDAGCAGTHVGSQANPYDDLSDINWTTGGDNSIFDYLAGTPAASPTIYLNKGDTWREQLNVSTSGTATYPIIITSYGSGANPIINAADLVSTWTAYGNDVASSPAANNDNFILLMASPCIDAGTDVSLTEDYQGLKIRHAPDIGAHENQTNALFGPVAKLFRRLYENYRNNN